jgi:hypothetical protein
VTEEVSVSEAMAKGRRATFCVQVSLSLVLDSMSYCTVGIELFIRGHTVVFDVLGLEQIQLFITPLQLLYCIWSHELIKSMIRLLEAYCRYTMVFLGCIGEVGFSQSVWHSTRTPWSMCSHDRVIWTCGMSTVRTHGESRN